MPSMFTNHVPQCHTSVLNTSRNRDSTISLGSLLQYFTTLSEKKFFLKSNLNISCHYLKSFLLILSLVTWKMRPNLTFPTTLFQVVVESDKVSPDCLLLQSKQSHLPQPILIKLVHQTLHQLCSASLHMFQGLKVF